MKSTRSVSYRPGQIRRSARGRKTTTIRQREFIPASPDEIYDALLNERRHAAFTGSGATCDRRVGGKFTAWDGYISGTNITLENSRKIVQEWKTSDWPPDCRPSLLELTFKAKGGGTEVRMVQKNVPSAQAEAYRKGWVNYYWSPLKKYFRRR
jgi:activator of HSP90 ATPase